MFKLVFYVGGLLPAYMSVRRVSDVCGSQKRGRSLLELELQTVVSRHGVLGIKSKSPKRLGSALNH